MPARILPVANQAPLKTEGLPRRLLFRPFGAHQHSVANGGAAHPRYLYDDKLGCGCGTHKNIVKVTSKSYLEYAYVLHVVVSIATLVSIATIAT